jgi:hypothetical protein
MLVNKANPSYYLDMSNEDSGLVTLRTGATPTSSSSIFKVQREVEDGVQIFSTVSGMALGVNGVDVVDAGGRGLEIYYPVTGWPNDNRRDRYWYIVDAKTYWGNIYYLRSFVSEQYLSLTAGSPGTARIGSSGAVMISPTGSRYWITVPLTNSCLDVAGNDNARSPGTPVNTYDCTPNASDPKQDQLWVLL